MGCGVHAADLDVPAGRGGFSVLYSGVRAGGACVPARAGGGTGQCFR